MRKRAGPLALWSPSLQSPPVTKRSAGLLLYRFHGNELQVLLAHPGGPYWARKDDGAWSIPKGELDEGEEALAAARREFAEELGSCPAGDVVALKPLRQKGGKLVQAWAMQADFDPAALVSNTFEMEWPPRSGRMQTFPEVDRAAWLTLAEARVKILASQAPLLEELESIARA